MVLIICFTLLAGVSTGMAASIDTIVSSGSLVSLVDGNNANAAFTNFSNPNNVNNNVINQSIFNYFEDKPFELLDTSWTWISGQTGVKPWETSNLGIEWNFIVFAYRNGSEGEWFLFADDFALGVNDSDLLSGDNVLTLAPGGINMGKGNPSMKWWYVQITAGISNPDVSLDGTPEVPEPGTILLLGTGIIGLGLVAKRKLNKK